MKNILDLLDSFLFLSSDILLLLGGCDAPYCLLSKEPLIDRTRSVKNNAQKQDRNQGRSVYEIWLNADRF